jgi:hypothetical protein
MVGEQWEEPVSPVAPLPPPLPGEPEDAREPGEDHPVIAWTKAIWGGIGDTAKQMLSEGRKEAAQAYDDGWRRFDDKTRYRRLRK